MALIFPGSRCAICDTDLSRAYTAPSGVAFPPGHELWRFCDAPFASTPSRRGAGAHPMSWVSEAVEALRQRKPVSVRPRGGSMRGRIEDGQLVTLAPVDPLEVRAGDVVLVRWKGNVLLHLVKEADGDRLLIGNNVGKINGWVARTDVLGRLVE